MICNDLSEMVLELRILLHDKVAIQQINKHKLMKQGGWIQFYYLCPNLIVILIELL
jgi:hypothetical protein